MNPAVTLLGSTEFACVLVRHLGCTRVVCQSDRVDLIADLAMELSNDRELAICAWAARRAA